jgi:Ca2+-binding EF-hand superfamily protein
MEDENEFKALEKEINKKNKKEEEEEEDIYNYNNEIDRIQKEIKYGLTEEQKEEFKSIFEMYDKNKTGIINLKELKLVFSKIGFNKNEEEFNKIIGKKIKESGKIKLEEFYEIMKKNMLPTESITEDELEYIFHEFDKNKDGLITHSELKASMKNITGEDFEDVDIDNMLECVSENSLNSGINLEVFKKIFKFEDFS